MKKLFYLFLYCFITMLFAVTEVFSAVTAESPTKGVNLPKGSFGSLKQQIRVDDSILDNNGVNSKEFTMSVRVWIDNISQEQLSYLSTPLFGINMTNFYGITTMADIVIDKGAYNVKASKSAASTAVAGDKHNNVNARVDEWVWLTLVVNDEEGWAKLYCDGEECSNLDYSSNGKIFRDGEEAVFHCTNGVGYSSLSIRYDDLKISNRVLSEEEIASLYYAYEQGSIPEYINAYYTFDETTGTVNEYPNLVGGSVVAQVVEGTTDFSGGSYSPTIAENDAMCDGWTPIYQDKETFTVNVTTEGEGEVILKDYDGNEYKSGDAFMKDSTVFIIATPAEDYIVSEISVNDVKQEDIENVSFNITKNTEIKVVFILKGALVNMADDSLEGGTFICVDPATDTEYSKDATGKYYSIPYNSKVKVKTTAEEGYKLSSITVTSEGNSQELELGNPVFTIEKDEYEIKVVFIARYSLNYNVEGEGGTISVMANGQEAVSGKIYDAGTEIEVTVTPDNGYELEKLTINGNEVEVKDNTYNTSLDQNIDIIAMFTEISSIDSNIVSKAYYNSEDGIFYAGETSVLKVYSLNGTLLKEVVDNKIDINSLNISQCIITVNSNSKSATFKIIK